VGLSDCSGEDFRGFFEVSALVGHDASVEGAIPCEEGVFLGGWCSAKAGFVFTAGEVGDSDPYWAWVAIDVPSGRREVSCRRGGIPSGGDLERASMA